MPLPWAAAIRLSDMAKARGLLETARKTLPPLSGGSANTLVTELAERSALSYIERNVGVGFAIEGKWEEAGVHWRRAIRVCSTNATAHYLEGCYHQVNGDYSFGIICMQRSIVLDPDFRSAYIGLSNCYLLSADFAPAIEACEGCLCRFPDALAAQFNIGQAVYQLLWRNSSALVDVVERTQAAIQALETARIQAPDLWTRQDDGMLRWFQLEDDVLRTKLPREAVHIWRVFGWRP